MKGDLWFRNTPSGRSLSGSKIGAGVRVSIGKQANLPAYMHAFLHAGRRACLPSCLHALLHHSCIKSDPFLFQIFVSFLVLLLAKDSNFTSISDPEMGSGENVEDVIIPELPQEHIDALIQNPYFGNPRDLISSTPVINDLHQTSETTNTSDPGHIHLDTSREHPPAPVESHHSSISPSRPHQSIPIWNGADDLPTGETSLSDTNAESLHQVEESKFLSGKIHILYMHP